MASEFDQDAFAKPPVAARPQLRWWWPGGAVQVEELVGQLRAFHARGFGGVEIQPFRVGLPHAMPDALTEAVNDYATPSFFEKVAAVAAEAHQLGMVVDFTFGSCWPFGGGLAITPELAASELTLAWTSVRGPTRYNARPAQPVRPARSATCHEREGTLPSHRNLPDGWAQRIEARERVVAVLALRGTAPSLGPYPGFVPMSLPDVWGQVLGAGWVDAEATVDLTDRLQADGTLAWDVPPGSWQIVVCKQFVVDQVLGDAAGSGPQLVADHLNVAAFEAHARRVGEAGLAQLQPWIGRGLRAIFVDSLEIQADMHWCDDFELEFERRRGYAPRRYLPLMLHPGWRNAFQARKCPPLFDDAALGDRIRADYRRTVSELMLERLYAPFAAWARARGLQSRTQAHGAPVDWLQAYGLASMPETEDLMGGGAACFFRVARSAAHLYGRPLVSAEAFVWLVEGLAVTPRKVRARADAMFAAGVQQIIGHGASYPLALPSNEPGGTTQSTWYPWKDFEFSTQLDPASSLWPHLGPLASYMARSQSLLRTGDAIVPVAVLAPLDLFGFESAGARINDPVWDQALQSAGYDWNWLNADGLLACTMRNGVLHTPGGHRYQVLVLPAAEAMRCDVAEALAQHVAEGLVVLALEHWPKRHEGLHQHQHCDARLQNAVDRLRELGSTCVITRQVGDALAALGVAPALDWQGAQGLRFNERRAGAQRLFFLHNPLATRVTTTPKFDGICELNLWDAWRGESRSLAVVQADGGTRVTLSLEPGQGVFVVACSASSFDHKVVAQASAASLPAFRLAHEAWRLAAQGNGLRGRRVNFSADLPALIDLATLPELADFAGTARYEADVQLDVELPAGVCLDFGEVRDTVSASIDGAAPTICCEGPFMVQLTTPLRSGVHRLVVEVCNVGENAMRDPACPGGLPLPGRRLSRLPCGLLGPVRWCMPGM